MNERDAERQGYMFTGMCWSKYVDVVSGKVREEADKYKAKAKKIKDTYEGADYIIVTGNKNSWLGNDSRGIWGNKIFNMVKDYDEEKSLAFIHSYCDRVEQARKDYEAALQKISDENDEAIRKYNYIQSLKKVK